MLTFMTEDGYKFYLRNDGCVYDTASGDNYDMSWPSLAEFLKEMGNEDIGLTVVVGRSVKATFIWE